MDCLETDIAVSKIESRLRLVWCAETSYDSSTWSNKNPAMGQCAVSSLIIQDYLNGEILWAEVDDEGIKVSHYFNQINEKVYDTTSTQFQETTKLPIGVIKKGNFLTTREYLFSNTDTLRRYNLLKVLYELAE